MSTTEWRQWWCSLAAVLVLALAARVATSAPAPSSASSSSSSYNSNLRSRSKTIDSATMSGAVDFLTKFGYMAQSDLETGNLRTEEQLRDAIRTMQKFAGIAETGVVDETTVDVMRRKRCGIPDLVGTSERVKRKTTTRRRRYALQGAKWDKTDLTWSISRDVGSRRDHIDEGSVRRDLARAFKVWSDATKLSFREVHPKGEPDITISFARGYHGDGYAFDGPGSILAHAFFPGPGLGGDTHFDDEEKWEAASDDGEGGDGVSLFAVAAHEFGHSLGLSHSREPTALMYPYYQWFGTDYTLPEDDRMGIQQLYGAKNDREFATLPDMFTRPHATPRPPTRATHPPRPPTRRPPVGPTDRPMPPTDRPLPPTDAPTDNDGGEPEEPGKPKTCDTSYDAISVIRREVFIFKDKYFWRLDDRGLQENYPVAINRFWYNLPKDLKRIDAIYERPKDKKILIFIGQQYWLFEANHPVPGYPKNITNLGLPKTVKRLDAAFVWGHNGKPYFFSGKDYWRFDETDGRVELDYPRSMAMWKGVPYNVDAAFQWTDGRTYFFKDKSFWKFDDQKMRVESADPTPSAPFWMGCTPGKFSKQDANRAAGAEGHLQSHGLNGAASLIAQRPLLVSLVVSVVVLLATAL